MIATKKVQMDADTSYEVAAARHRAEVIANRTPHPDEIRPVGGNLHLSLIGTPLAFGAEAAVFGKSRIVIPEFREECKKK